MIKRIFNSLLTMVCCLLAFSAQAQTKAEKTAGAWECNPIASTSFP